MSQPEPSRQVPQQPVSYFVLPPAPPTVVRPIPAWVWISSAILAVALLVGSLAAFRWVRRQSHLADDAVAALHQKMTTGDDAGIVAEADPAYRDGVPSTASEHIFANIRSRLGAPHAARQISFNRADDPNVGEFITLHYRTVFDKGRATETICFRRSNGAWKLAGYNVESPLLQNAKQRPAVRLSPTP